MKKLVIVLVVLMTLVTFVACKHEKDPIKDNLAIGNWEAQLEQGPYTMIITLEVKNDKTASMIMEQGGDSFTYTGTWTATSISEGSFNLSCLGQEDISGPFKAEASKLTVTIEGPGEIEFKKAVK